ncbi:MAG TPA: DUF6468 domain-containing protein [Alphaproteobacteria bacterium]|nr:DUF6468 domain-containing protein [Alphaproteobacteria bacterium]
MIFTPWIEAGLDVVLIALLGAGLLQVARLVRHLAGLGQSRAEMQRFVHEFGATVARAEAGIKGLKAAARDSGDDLEKLIDKAAMIRDELQFLTESADQIAARLGEMATDAVRALEKAGREKAAAPKLAEPPPAAPREKTAAETAAKAGKKPGALKSASRAEEELLQALQKLG